MPRHEAVVLHSSISDMEKPPLQPSWSLHAAVATAAIGSFNFGYNTGIIAGALIYIKEDYTDMTPFWRGALVSCILLSAMLAAPLTSSLASRLGRRPALLWNNVPYIVGALGMAFAPNFWTLLGARTVAGLGVGMSSTLANLYIGELAPTDVRGRLGALAPFAVTSGILVSYFASYGLSHLPDTVSWRWMLGAAVAPPVVQVVIGVVWPAALPETPRWLLEHGRTAEAASVLARLYTDPIATDPGDLRPFDVATATADWGLSSDDLRVLAGEAPLGGRGRRKLSSGNGSASAGLLSVGRAASFAGDKAAGAAAVDPIRRGSSGFSGVGAYGATGRGDLGAALRLEPGAVAGLLVRAAALLPPTAPRVQEIARRELVIMKEAIAKRRAEAVRTLHEIGVTVQSPVLPRRGSANSQLSNLATVGGGSAGGGDAGDGGGGSGVGSSAGVGGIGDELPTASGTNRRGSVGSDEAASLLQEVRGATIPDVPVMTALKALFTKYPGPTATGIGLNVLQQVSGVNVVVYFAPTVFLDAGFAKQASILLTALVGVAQLLATGTLMGLVDRFGRKPLTLVGLLGMIVGLSVLGASFMPGIHGGAVARWLAVGGVLAFRVMFSFSLGPLPYIITAEVFPPGYSSLGVGVSWAANWLANFAVSLTFLPIEKRFGPTATFFAYTGCCVLAVVFVACGVKETAGVRLEDAGGDGTDSDSGDEGAYAEAARLSGQWDRGSVQRGSPVAARRAGR